MQVVKPNSALNPPMAVQPPVPGLPPHAAPSFSYNIPHSGVAFSGNQHVQSSAVRLVRFLFKLKSVSCAIE